MARAVGVRGPQLTALVAYRIATNTCLDVVARRPARVLPIAHAPAADLHEPLRAPLVETTWLEPYPDEHLDPADGLAGPAARYRKREGIELAFVAALQHLPARQRAVLILREVLDFSAREVADALETSVASVNNALRRARQNLDGRRLQHSQHSTLRGIGGARLRGIAERYTDALQRADVDAILTMLTEDATWSMPPLPTWYRGHESIAAFLEAEPLRLRWRHVATRANGQLAIGGYVWDPSRRVYGAFVLDVLTLRGERIGDVTGFLDRTLFPRFGLADELPQDQ